MSDLTLFNDYKMKTLLSLAWLLRFPVWKSRDVLRQSHLLSFILFLPGVFKTGLPEILSQVQHKKT